MPDDSATAVRHTPPTPVLDDLELLRSGAWSGYAAGGGVEILLPDGAVPTASAASVLEVTDPEGAFLAHLPLVRDGIRLVARGRPTWLGHRSSRPFEQWHADPDADRPCSGLVVLDRPVAAETLSAALDRAGEEPLLLVLTSLDGDQSSTALAAARQAVETARSRPATRVAIAPLHPQTKDYPAKRVEVVRRYAAGAPVEELAGAALSEPTGTALFLTGLSGSGKSTVARAVRNALLERGERVTLLDGDVVRRHLSEGLGFSAADRDINIRRIGWVAAEIVHHGGIAVSSSIAPFDATRKAVRAMVEHRGGRFLLVHVATPLAECERRDRKGLYARARRGEIADFTGISSPYEVADDAELSVDTTGRTVEEVRDEVLEALDDRTAPRDGGTPDR